MKKLFVASVICMSFLWGTISAIISPNSVAAISGSDFNAGNIISDTEMRDYGSMSEGDIQNFLKSKNSCNDTRTYIADWYPQVYYHIENGHFVCMADESFNGKSAASIIYHAAQDYRINPKVLIVLLQKEQGLVTDTFPHNLQYRSATGYGCPDNSICDAKYYGFENQVRNAAALFDDVMNGGWTNYPVGWRWIYYYPNANCGGTNVYIENRATSALYRYTPYQPNQAAKNADYGTGDGCSTYGNRNFFLYYNDWFGMSTTSTSSYPPGSVYIPDGEYQFLTTSGRALDVANAGTSDGTNLWIWAKNDTVAQTFRIYRFSDGYYRIMNPNSNKSLDAANAGMSPGTNVWLWSNNYTCAQKWTAEMYSNGRVAFKNACSGLALDVEDGHTATNGANIQLVDANGTNAQQFRLVALDSAPVRGGTYNIRSVEGKTTLDIYGAGSANGTNLQVWEKNDTVAQFFKLSRGTDGYYRILNPNSGKSLDLANAGLSNGTNVWLWDNNDTCAQKWAIAPLGDHYTIRSACSGKALDVDTGSTINGTNVQTWDYLANNNQKWLLVGRR